MTNNIKKISLPVLEMSCASCAVNVESILKTQEGVINASVNYANQSAQIEFDSKATTLDKLKKAVIDIGYDIVIDLTDEKEEQLAEMEEKRLKELKQNLIIAILFSVPVFILSMFFMHAFRYEHWILLFLSVPVLFWSGFEFYQNAWKLAKHFMTNMDTLVALGTGIAFLFSAINTIYPEFLYKAGLTPHVYFESATIIITFILLGRYLEERSKSKASSAIKKLMGLQPKTLTVIRDGNEINIPLNEVRLNDIVLVKPGEKVPVDGKVSSGNSFVDESMLTGEVISEEKQNGSKVFAGTINQNGSLEIVAQKIGRETVLAQIIKLVQEAQSSKPPIQKLVDRISAIFVPTIIIIAIITFLVWYFAVPSSTFQLALLNMISVLIIACPCALGLATPTALVVGIGRAAEKGILIKNSDTIENAQKINTVVFDKTGTITSGKPQVSELYFANPSDFPNLKDLENLIYSIESQSNHPLAEAISEKLRTGGATKLPVESFENNPGKGVNAKVNGRNYFIGNDKLLLENNITDNMFQQAEKLREEAKTVIYFADDKTVLAIIAIADTIKETSIQAIKKLKEMNMEVHMLTGDNKHTAAVIAGKAGITNYTGEILPEGKVKYIKDLQEKGKIVAMVGDGINDSAALAQAEVGIAMAAGSDIAMETAGITLMNSDLKSVISAIRLSKATVRTIKQNLFWAFFYNIIAIPIAAGILYPFTGFLLNPMIAGAAMALSSVTVVMNSLRLRFKM